MKKKSLKISKSDEEIKDFAKSSKYYRHDGKCCT
jgi:hypothetical protein